MAREVGMRGFAKLPWITLDKPRAKSYNEYTQSKIVLLFPLKYGYHMHAVAMVVAVAVEGIPGMLPSLIGLDV